jgi:hypothetical protein
MITTQTMPKTPTRTITAKVEQYNGSTLLNTFSYNDALKSIDINRTCEEGKLFGMCISQKAEIKLIEGAEGIVINDKHTLKIYFDNGQGYLCPLPTFYITELKRDKVKRELTLTAFCLLEKANKHTVAELQLSSYTTYSFLTACASLLGANGVALVNITETDKTLTLSYEQGANFAGTEKIREALTALAEVTHTIIYFDYNNNLTLKRVNRNIVDTVTTTDYFSFDYAPYSRITKIASITELGDNIEADSGLNNVTGATTAYLRNNPFLELRDDVPDILTYALQNLKNLQFINYDLNTRGNYLIEIGDYFAVTDKAGSPYRLYLLNDSLKYNGGFSQKLSLHYNEGEQTASNPATLGETLRATSAKVDKVNRKIELLASEENINASKLAALEITTGNISASVESVQQANETLHGTVGELTQKVNATMSAEDIKLEIKTEIANGTAKVETATGYTFNEDGLTISKSGSEMTTTITEDGMTVKKDGNAVLTANNEGVTAIDLKAQTYLIIGKNSRLQDNGNRTVCFWIGGSSL